MKIQAEHLCTIEVEPSHTQKGYVWLNSRTAIEINLPILLSPEAVKQLRKALKNGVSISQGRKSD